MHPGIVLRHLAGSVVRNQGFATSALQHQPTLGYLAAGVLFLGNAALYGHGTPLEGRTHPASAGSRPASIDYRYLAVQVVSLCYFERLKSSTAVVTPSAPIVTIAPVLNPALRVCLCTAVPFPPPPPALNDAPSLAS